MQSFNWSSWRQLGPSWHYLGVELGQNLAKVGPLWATTDRFSRARIAACECCNWRRTHCRFTARGSLPRRPPRAAGLDQGGHFVCRYCRFACPAELRKGWIGPKWSVCGPCRADFGGQGVQGTLSKGQSGRLWALPSGFGGPGRAGGAIEGPKWSFCGPWRANTVAKGSQHAKES